MIKKLDLNIPIKRQIMTQKNHISNCKNTNKYAPSISVSIGNELKQVSKINNN